MNENLLSENSQLKKAQREQCVCRSTPVVVDSPEQLQELNATISKLTSELKHARNQIDQCEAKIDRCDELPQLTEEELLAIFPKGFDTILTVS